ncbi:lipocalin family protein [Gaetbulibacter sp. M240]|uniref:lipocalin family protein n=1 Tax=Gaetbulibacter sp. M240 TaxID=3126511 RepID=UPI00374E5A2C
MKKLMMILLTLSLVACGASKTVRTAKKTIKGTWNLSNITYDRAGTYNIKLLDDASKTCFEGSDWQFIPNNNTGIYTISDSSCTSGERYFIFTIDEVDAQTGLYDFLLKPTNAKGRSETNEGFRIKLSSLTETSMQWQQTVMVDGSPFTISMNFIKS